MQAQEAVFAVRFRSLCRLSGGPRRADDSALTDMDPDLAKEYGGKLTEQFNKEFKDLPVKNRCPMPIRRSGSSTPTRTRASCLSRSRDFTKRTRGPRTPKRTTGSGCATSSCTSSFKPLADGKPADAKRLRIMKFKDSEGNEHETLCLECSVKHVEDDWQLMIFSGDKEPLAKSSFEEATDAPKADLALTIKNAKDDKSTLTINLFGKYCVGIPVSHKAK